MNVAVTTLHPSLSGIQPCQTSRSRAHRIEPHQLLTNLESLRKPSLPAHACLLNEYFHVTIQPALRSNLLQAFGQRCSTYRPIRLALPGWSDGCSCGRSSTCSPILMPASLKDISEAEACEAKLICWQTWSGAGLRQLRQAGSIGKGWRAIGSCPGATRPSCKRRRHLLRAWRDPASAAPAPA